jgi:hypothetical protein
MPGWLQAFAKVQPLSVTVNTVRALAEGGGTAAPGPELHRHRQVAESFGEDPERYDRARLPYPGALVDRVVAASPGPDFLDVGCGG